jgi:VanZ family protein
LLLLCCFALESSAAFGADHTSRPLHAFFHLLAGASVDPNWSFLHHLIRKTGHFAGYGLFSMALFRGLTLTPRCLRKLNLLHLDDLRIAAHATAVAATLLVAGLDELHQSFLPNRTGKLSDVLLDTAGALTVQLAVFGITRLGAVSRSRLPRLHWGAWRQISQP